LKVEIVSSEVKYILTYDELCKALKIRSGEGVDFIDLKLDPPNEKVIITQVESVEAYTEKKIE